jgi:peptide/nickel transport system permease protein
VALAVIVGVGIGTLAGYFAGIADALLMRLTDIQMAFPFIILAISILSVTTPGILVLIVVLSLAAWPTYARVMRSIVLVDAQADYVLVARSIGASHARIIVQYLLRNVFLTVLILSTLDIATMIVLEALLSFLGLGIQPPTPSLGVVMADGRNYLAIGDWWITTMPGVMILFALLGMNLFGDALQSRLDPRLRRL